jgi:hypothetical protein
MQCYYQHNGNEAHKAEPVQMKEWFLLHNAPSRNGVTDTASSLHKNCYALPPILLACSHPGQLFSLPQLKFALKGLNFQFTMETQDAVTTELHSILGGIKELY